MKPEVMIIVFSLLMLIAVAIAVIRILLVRNKIDQLKSNSMEMTPEEFFRMRNASNGGRGRQHISTGMDFPGIYILYNETKNMYCIGKGQKVLSRVNSQFTGHGNGDVYADYKYGCKFKISTIALEGSGFATLNDLERNAIQRYSAFSHGYNKTRGSRK